jgi:hypothetical protein
MDRDGGACVTAKGANELNAGQDARPTGQSLVPHASHMFGARQSLCFPVATTSSLLLKYRRLTLDIRGRIYQMLDT